MQNQGTLKSGVMIGLPERIKSIIPGFAVSAAVAMASVVAAKFIPNVGAASIAIFLGMIVGNLSFDQSKMMSGYKFSETDLLAYSIVLLGATLSVGNIMALGVGGIMFIVIQMAITIVSALFIGKKLGFGNNFRYLMASGNAVCGSSAIAATAPVVGADDNDKGIAITIVNVTGIVLMFLLPAITAFLYGNETLRSSAMIGGILQSIGQVVASGAIVGPEVKDMATIFKLVRVVCIIFVVIFFTILKSREEKKNGLEMYSEEAAEKGGIKIPWYVIGFFITCALFSMGFIPENVSMMCKEISNKFEIIALAAIGLKVNVKELLRQGKDVTMYGAMVGTVQVAAALILINLFF
ncbi:YeiH family protein [Peptacetobacter hominis]|nr:putative sulfate exporter family transporter [Peptacetobacter hominis]